MRYYIKTEYGWIGERDLPEDKIIKQDKDFVFFMETEVDQYFNPYEIEERGYKDFHKARLALLQERKDELAALQKTIEILETAKDYQDYKNKEFPWRNE